MLNKILFILACLLLPILWGVIVNWFFNSLRQRKSNDPEDDSVFPDYQI